MRRSVPLLLSSMLALVTGVALLAAGHLMTTPASEAAGGSGLDPDIAAPNIALVRRFYDAVNQTLRTGDAGLLDEAISSDLVEHMALPGLPRHRASLSRYIVSLSSAFPAMRLTVVDLLAQGDEVMARVRVGGVDRGAFLGIPLPAELAVWGPLDVFRVEHGEIVEHWPSRDGAALFRPLARAPLDLPAAGATLQVSRITYALGSVTAARRNTQLRVVFLEEGSLDVRIGGSALLDRASVDRAPVDGEIGGLEAVPIAGEVRLHAGDLLILPVAAAYRTSNPTEAPALAIEVALVLPQPLTPMTDKLGPVTTSGAVTARLLASTLLPDAAEPFMMGTGQAVLAPGASIPSQAAAGQELFQVEAGLVDRESGSGIAWTSGNIAAAFSSIAAPTLRPRESPLRRPKTNIASDYVGTGPAALIVVTVGPAGEIGVAA